jgi:hypothetical protein
MAEGKAEGKVEGKAEGKVEGKAEMLVQFLTTRFGPLGPALHARVYAADLATIESWFGRAINAADLPSVFDPPLREALTASQHLTSDG